MLLATLEKSNRIFIKNIFLKVGLNKNSTWCPVLRPTLVIWWSSVTSLGKFNVAANISNAD